MTTDTSLFAITPRGHLVAEVVNRIQEMVINRELSPGDSLPPEDQLAQQMQVSRTALREGKRILADRGLIEVRQGVGTVVCEVGEEQLTAQLRLYAATRLGGIDFEQFHGVRELIEIEIAALSAHERDDEQLRQLQQTVDAMRSSVGDNEALTREDVGFHVLLAQMSGNPLLAVLSSVIRDLLATYIGQVITHIDPAVDIIPFHAAIVDAVSRRDADGARAAMSAHLAQARANYQTAQSSTG